jgi:hypothetical protein
LDLDVTEAASHRKGFLDQVSDAGIASERALGESLYYEKFRALDAVSIGQKLEHATNDRHLLGLNRICSDDGPEGNDIDHPLRMRHRILVAHRLDEQRSGAVDIAATA